MRKATGCKLTLFGPCKQDGILTGNSFSKSIKKRALGGQKSLNFLFLLPPEFATSLAPREPSATEPPLQRRLATIGRPGTQVLATNPWDSACQALCCLNYIVFLCGTQRNCPQNSQLLVLPEVAKAGRFRSLSESN